MGKHVLVAAVILLLAGVIIASYSSVSIVDFDESMLDYKENTREVSGFFEDGEKINLKFWPTDEWKEAVIEPAIPGEIDYPHLFIYFNITGPQNMTASFEVAVVRLQYNSTPYVYQIRVLATGSLTVPVVVKNQTREIGGVVNRTGNYTVVIDMIMPSTVATMLPQSLTLYKGIPQKGYPFFYLLPIGAMGLVSGFVLLLWGKKKSKKERRKRGGLTEQTYLASF